jgi:hypothetical protein
VRIPVPDSVPRRLVSDLRDWRQQDDCHRDAQVRDDAGSTGADAALVGDDAAGAG